MAQNCLENFLVLLSVNNCLATASNTSVLDLPTNDDMSEFLDCVTEDTQKRSPVNEMYSIVIEEEVQ